MSRGWFILLAVMVGLNAALLYDKFAPGPSEGRHSDRQHSERRERFRGDPEERHEERLERHLDRMTEQLDLDDAQREQLREIKTVSFEALSPLRQSVREKRHEVRELLQAADLDTARIRELSAELLADMAQLERIATENFIREATVLTPEQREKYLERRSFGPRGRGGPNGRRHPPGDGPPPDHGGR